MRLQACTAFSSKKLGSSGSAATATAAIAADATAAATTAALAAIAAACRGGSLRQPGARPKVARAAVSCAVLQRVPP